MGCLQELPIHGSFRESVTGILLPVASREGTPEKLMPIATKQDAIIDDSFLNSGLTLP